jgi:hypothetical protein
MQDTSQPSGKMDALHLGTLIKMLESREARERDIAVRVLKEIIPEDITVLLTDPKLSPQAIVYFARHAGERRDWIEALLSNPSLAEEDRALLVVADIVSPKVAMAVSEDEVETVPEEEKHLSISQRIQRMNIGQKIKAGMTGDKEFRTILIKDTNKDVYKAVLKNPGLKENEIEMLTKNTGTNVEILRAIASNREWVANRNILKGLVMNPKTPVNLSIRFMTRMSKKDLELIAMSRSLPVALRNNAKRMTSTKVKRK